MIQRLDRLGERELVLAALVALVLGGLPLHRGLLRPAHDRWQAARQALGQRRAEHARLQEHLGRRAQVERRVAGLGPDAVQQESDAITVSRWLRQLEQSARRYGLRCSMKAKPATDEKTHKVYRVWVSLSGRLPEVLQFVAAATEENATTGLDGYTLRGVPGDRLVECSLSLRMVKLLMPGPAAVGPVEPAVAQGVSDAL